MCWNPKYNANTSTESTHLNYPHSLNLVFSKPPLSCSGTIYSKLWWRPQGRNSGKWTGRGISDAELCIPQTQFTKEASTWESCTKMLVEMKKVNATSQFHPCTLAWTENVWPFLNLLTLLVTAETSKGGKKGLCLGFCFFFLIWPILRETKLLKFQLHINVAMLTHAQSKRFSHILESIIFFIFFRVSLELWSKVGHEKRYMEWIFTENKVMQITKLQYTSRKENIKSEGKMQSRGKE